MIKSKTDLKKATLIGISAFTLGLLTARADIKIWNTATGDWHTAANWAALGVPADGDDVVVTNDGALVILTSSTARLNSMVISNATLSCSNWDTTIYVANLTIRSGGDLTCEGPFTNNAVSNRVNLTCTNLFIEAGGAINVNGKGYSGGINSYTNNMPGHGPGGGMSEIMGTPANIYRSGAGYGGAGLYQSGRQLQPNTVYGSATAPLDPGSGGSGGTSSNTVLGGHGGGAVCITAAQVVVNGSISADASDPSSTNGKALTYCCGGSGGGIYITCVTINGTNGAITANGSDCAKNSNAGGGGGGRIAIHYDQSAQNLLPVPSLRFSASAGIGNATVYSNTADIGTLYFTDGYFFSPTNLFTGQWIVPGLTKLSFSEMVVSNTWARLGSDLTLTVTNTLTVVGSNNYQCRLEITNACALSCGAVQISQASLVLGARTRESFNNYALSNQFMTMSTSGPSLDCRGNLTLTNSALFLVSAGLTNSRAAAGYGALVTVGGDIVVATNCWIYPIAHPTNGSVVIFNARSVTIDKGGGFNANYLGYAGGLRPGDAGANKAYGPGISTNNNSGNASANAGSSYGGLGTTGTFFSGKVAPVYGSSNAPIDPGSGARGGWASGSENGAYGGGSVRINAANTLTIKGSVYANGGAGPASYGTGASGGGIYLTCRTFIGDSNSVLSANGGNGYFSTYNGGGGGGGRIAVWRIFDTSPSVISNYVNGGKAYSGETGGPGTIVWGWLVPPKGSILSIY